MGTSKEEKKEKKSRGKNDKTQVEQKTETDCVEDDTIVFVPLRSSSASNIRTKKTPSKEFHKRLGSKIKSSESDNFISMLRTEKKDDHVGPRMLKSRSSFSLVSNKEQTVIRNGAAPEGFSPKEFKVSCGTLSALIKHLTSDCDVEFRTTFLLTYRGFTTPCFLMRAIADRFRESSGDGVSVVQLRVFGALKAWIENHWKHDFESDEDLKELLEEFISKELDGPVWGPRAKQIRSLIERISVPKAQVAVETFPEPILPTVELSKQRKFMVLGSLSATEVARQIAIYAFHIYESITPAELLNQAWCSKDKEQRAPNILRMIHFFNEIARWSSQNIVWHTKLSDRIEALRWFISLSEELFKVNDVSSSLAVQSGLDSTEVNRLSRTWKGVGDIWMVRWKQLTNMTQSDKNHKMLRYHILQCDPPLIPFIGLYLKDLTFIEDGNATVLESGLINVDKCTKVSNVIQSIQQYQRLGYHLLFEELPAFVEWLNTWELLEEEDLFQRSLLVEPKKLDWDAYDALVAKYDALLPEEIKPPQPLQFEPKPKARRKTKDEDDLSKSLQPGSSSGSSSGRKFSTISRSTKL